jgi:hypothetical protein
VTVAESQRFEGEIAMSYKDGPPDPTEEEEAEYNVKQNIDHNPAVSITGLTAEDIRAVIAGLIDSKYRLDEEAREQIKKQAERAVSELTDEVAREAIRSAVATTIAAGVSEYDRFTGSVIKSMTIAEMVQKELTGTRSEGGYGKPAQTPAQKAVADAVAELFAKELKSEIEAIKKSFKEQADAVFKARLVDALKDAMGLK